MSNFQPLEVVDRGSETQPQVVENLNKLTWSLLLAMKRVSKHKDLQIFVLKLNNYVW